MATSTLWPSPVRSRWTSAPRCRRKGECRQESRRPRRPPWSADVGIAGRIGDAAHRLDGDVHGGEIAIGPVEPEARAAAVDQPRIELVQHIPAQPQPLHDANGEVLDQDVGLGDQLEEDLACRAAA